METLIQVNVVLPRFSVGCGDRFAHEAEAQLRAFALLRDQGVTVSPVWNKSNREHMLIGSEPGDTRVAADAAVQALRWSEPYFVDADHISRATVERFLAPCDFFTIDVAAKIGAQPESELVEAFVGRHPELTGTVQLPFGQGALRIRAAEVRQAAETFLAAVVEAGETYREIAQRRRGRPFVTEISMDETVRAQTPTELLVILAAVADEGVPIQTIAPKFSGRFNKGVDYVGDVEEFERELKRDMAVLAHAKAEYGLPESLKLSIHSGSDKFRIYPAVCRAMRACEAGVHLKTAGTTWLEEVIGLAEAGGEGLEIVQEVYRQAYEHIDELIAPYADVIDLKRERLPRPEAMARHSSAEVVGALRHNASDARYNADLRQLFHVAFKLAARMGPRYTDALVAHREVIGRNVTMNLFERHMKPVFLGC